MRRLRIELARTNPVTEKSGHLLILGHAPKLEPGMNPVEDLLCQVFLAVREGPRSTRHASAAQQGSIRWVDKFHAQLLPCFSWAEREIEERLSLLQFYALPHESGTQTGEIPP
jgi:hypothetical protein